MPLFSILIVILLCRINANRKLHESVKQSQTDNGQSVITAKTGFSKIAIENIYVECNNNPKKTVITSNTPEYEAKASGKCVDAQFSSTKSQYANENSDNIYSIIDFSNENQLADVASSHHIFNPFNQSNFNLKEYQATVV